jgi:hypothetical protein
MSNNVGHPSSDAGYSNLELDLDDLDDIDLITNGTRLANNTTNRTRGRIATGPSINSNGNASGSTFYGSSRVEGSQSAANQGNRAGRFDFDTEDDSSDPLRSYPEPNQASGSRTTASRRAMNLALDARNAGVPPISPPPQGTSNVQRRNRSASSIAGENIRRRAVGLPELAPDASVEDRDGDINRRFPRPWEMTEDRVAARARRREAMEQAIERTPLPIPMRARRPATSAARERAEEAAAARRAAPADPGPTAAQLERRRRVANILMEVGDDDYGSYPFLSTS